MQNPYWAAPYRAEVVTGNVCLDEYPIIISLLQEALKCKRVQLFLWLFISAFLIWEIWEVGKRRA